MEPTHIPGDTEESSGIESGWTNYVVSPIHGGDGYYDDDGEGNQHRTYKEGYEDGKDDHNDDDDDDESNDSMASDASSGPNHHELPCVRSEGGNDANHIKYVQETDHSKYSVGKKSYKQVKRERRIKVKVEEEKLQLKANSAASHVGFSTRKKNLKGNDQ